MQDLASSGVNFGSNSQPPESGSISLTACPRTSDESSSSFSISHHGTYRHDSTCTVAREMIFGWNGWMDSNDGWMDGWIYRVASEPRPSRKPPAS